jgi:copper transporter 1
MTNLLLLTIVLNLLPMLWNWTTIDACFISKSWHITTNGMFAGSCVAVVFLVMVSEALRRASREYDAYINRTAAKPSVEATGDSVGDVTRQKGNVTASVPVSRPARPTAPQHAIRALLHVCQFAMAYFVMLLAMYYNGYIIICIFVGSYIGFFVFNWVPLGGGHTESQEVTVCCG